MGDANENPTDPICFELRLVSVMRKQPEDELGWKLRDTPHGAMVEQVADGSPMSVANVMVRDYVMSINGQRTKTMADVERAISDTPTSFRMIIARRRLARLDAETAALQEVTQRRPGWDYFVCR